MGRQRREFTPEYKDEAVKLVINTGRPVATVARELGVKEQTLGRWVNLYKSRQDAGIVSGRPENAAPIRGRGKCGTGPMYDVAAWAERVWVE